MAARPTLIIGNKNYSSWSLRAWLALRHFGFEFEEIRLPLDTEEFRERIGGLSPSRLVPALRDGERVVWDSLAICEYVNERLDGVMWPDDPTARARARSISAEMHAGFLALRSSMLMNCRARGRRVPRTRELDADIARVLTIWTECRERFGGGGEWLFGEVSIADAFYAPVALRFVTYGVETADPVAAAYVDSVLAHERVREWVAAGCEESEIVEADEVGSV